MSHEAVNEDLAGYEWKVGDWAEYAGTRCLVIDVRGQLVDVVRRVGGEWADRFQGIHRSPRVDHVQVKPLPECKGWDWQPEPTIGEGYDEVDYKDLQEGDEVFCNGYWQGYRHSMAYGNGRDKVWFRRKKPTHRPFANAVEFAPHFSRLIRFDVFFVPVRRFSNDSVTIGNRVLTYPELLRDAQFADLDAVNGKFVYSPCGVEVSQ